jgi:hypothetical protein
MLAVDATFPPPMRTLSRSSPLAALAHAAAWTLVVAGGLVGDATAQVRMNLRNGMQIHTEGSLGWPVEVGAFATGDVDGDGDIDLLGALNFGGGRLWRNDGAGGFTQFVDMVPLPPPPPLHSRSRSCALFDADGDGDLDALFGGGGTVYSFPSLSALFRNDGTGSFTPSATIPSHPINDSFETHSLAVGDCDGDGDPDVVVCRGNGSRYWRNDGTGTFVDHTAAAFPAGTSGPGTLADVEPDGDLDLVSNAALFRNNGLGVFTAEAAIPWHLPSPFRALADVDGDTLLDEVGIASNVPQVRRNLGGGQFQDVSSSWFEPHARIDRTYGNGYPYHAIAVFDADGDGDPDLVTAGTQGRGTTSTTVGIPPRVFLNSNRQRFVEAGQPALPWLPTVSRAVAAGDLDDDGDTDLVFGFGWGALWSGHAVWKQDAAGRFYGAGSIATGPFSPVGAFGLADFDGDQDLDLLALCGSEYVPAVGQHSLLLNDGDGSFTSVTATHMPATASNGRACAIGDVDGDGDLDAVVASYGPSGEPLILLRNTAGGVFVDASAQLPPTLVGSSAVALRDLDGDGDRDIVALPPSSGTRTAHFFANDGNGSFTDETATRMPAWSGSTPRHLSVVDLDNDGDLDLALDGVDLRNDGAGVFTATPVPLTRTHVLDLDENGAPDALVPGPAVAGGPVLWGDIAYHGHTVLPVDLDGDDDLDLVVCPREPDSDWQKLRLELLYNLRRDLRVATLPRIGTDYCLHLRATNGTGPTIAFAAVATALLPQPLPIPGWGTLRLDPAAMAVFAAVTIPDADTMVEVSMPVPNTPALFGLPVSSQARSCRSAIRRRPTCRTR